MVAKKREQPVVISRSDTEAEEEQARAAAIERFFAVADRIAARNADKDPDEELAYITEVVEEVRQERYEQAQRAASDRR
jgi:hypothetical protein